MPCVRRSTSSTPSVALARNPDDGFSHANQGWTFLDQGRRLEAMNHFRESLRLDPTDEWARCRANCRSDSCGREQGDGDFLAAR